MACVCVCLARVVCGAHRVLRSSLIGQKATDPQVIRDAAEASRVVAVTRIDVTGHADRAGSARYNDRLSRRRANSVKQGLIANGVPEKDIIIYARGEREPLVPTRDGVREPQNRRVEIVLN